MSNSAIPSSRRRTALRGLVAAALLGAASSAAALTIAEREALDLSDYTVNDPEAGYFDVEARMALLDDTHNAMLLQELDELATGVSCRQLLSIPPITTRLRVPGFYPNPEEWRLASEPLFQFEDSVSLLAGSFVATGDDYYADCLVTFLERWAVNDALMDFHYESMEPQAWFATESMIFAAAMAYSVVRPHVEDREQEQADVEDWLKRLSDRHIGIPGEEGNSCCNNHFYRRALYAAMVGVLLEDDELFQIGVSAVYSALHDLTEDGALPLEVARGRRATHYQNYALLYLIPIMEIVSRQGYDIYSLEIDGRDIHDAVDFLMQAIYDPANLGEDVPLEQFGGFLQDPQYFVWMELYQTRFDDPRIADFLPRLRPIYNRSAGGYMTLYVMPPEAQQQVIIDDDAPATQGFDGLAAH
ncbi:alginate lyase family protein [Halomonas sp. ML-15]|uniref:alginate lyase family protein n=1 Tax=Halomonas sp. ML-15 TaxID=2773305 RepID=UPI001745D1A4|nr:alginate lyase family protein [Halomonas sp. ML-15]MBD3897700.1 alginate lyase family protein [Halomonas sp. ML-15]